MNQKIVFAGVSIAALAIVFVLGASYVSVYNNGIALINAIEAKQKDNENARSALVQTLKNEAGVVIEGANMYRDIETAIAAARTKDGNAALMTWVQEAGGRFDQSNFAALRASIEGKFASFKAQQTQLIDLDRQWKVLKQGFFTRFVVGGWENPKYTILLDAQTRAEFESGNAEDLNLFNNQ